MSSADNIALYRRFIEEFDRPEVIDELLAPGIELPTLEGTGVEPTPEGLKQLRQAFLAGFPDLQPEIIEIIATGDWVGGHITWSGANTGEMFGQPPTGKRVSIGEFEIVRFQNGQIVDLRNTFDADALAVQLAN